MLELVAATAGEFSATLTPEQFNVFKELEASSYIVGQIGPDSHDAPDTMVDRVRLTTNGRLLMEQLRTERSQISPPLVNAAFVHYAAVILAERTSGKNIVGYTTSWAVDCGVDVPFAQTPLPLSTTKANALEKNLLAFSSPDRFRVIEAMAYLPELDGLQKVEELRKKLRALPPANSALPPMAPPPLSSAKMKSSGSLSALDPRAVFIVHGHDEANLLRLKEMLKERFHLNPIVLSGKAGKGRTIIEKFEAEAGAASFAFVLLSPDDVIKSSEGEYSQARPNVIFEPGWFYGRLGRDKVCILFKEGTEIHSDLQGVSRIQFRSSIGEKIDEIEKELAALVGE